MAESMKADGTQVEQAVSAAQEAKIKHSEFLTRSEPRIPPGGEENIFALCHSQNIHIILS